MQLWGSQRTLHGPLLSFDQVQPLLRGSTPRLRGTQRIPLAHIVGSVGRYRDFDRAFVPLNPAVMEHRKQILEAWAHGTLEPIDVYQIGDVYFVRDGNHRVSLARARGADTIEAHVTEVPSRVPLTPDVDAEDLIVKAEYADFLQQTRLDASRPGQTIEFTRPGHYGFLLEHIDVHRYYLGMKVKREVALDEAAASWYDNVYQPALHAIRDAKLQHEFPSRSEADLYLWVAYHCERLKDRSDEQPDYREAAGMLARQFSERAVIRLVKSVARALRAAVHAALESPEPPPH